MANTVAHDQIGTRRPRPVHEGESVAASRSLISPDLTLGIAQDALADGAKLLGAQGIITAHFPSQYR